MARMKPHVLVVDDDPVVRDLLRRVLQTNGMDVSVLHDGSGLRRRLTLERPSLILLDIMMPNLDGLQALKALREDGDDVPVIFLSGRGGVVDRVVGLEFGADDYLTKPCDSRELLARINAVLRRRGRVPSAAPEQRETFSFGPYTLDFTTRTLVREGARMELRDGEYALLKVFSAHPLTVLSRARLHDLLHGGDYVFRDRSLDVSAWRLRRVIESDPSNPRYVQTVRGKGYIFVPDAREFAELDAVPDLV
jgi:two-component system, OmpR family, phosphate regulon response regulator OmpR